MPIPFLKAIDISPLALVSDSVAGNGPAGSSTTDALEAVRELFSGDGQAKKGRKGQNEVCCSVLFISCKATLFLMPRRVSDIVLDCARSLFLLVCTTG